MKTNTNIVEFPNTPERRVATSRQSIVEKILRQAVREAEGFASEHSAIYPSASANEQVVIAAEHAEDLLTEAILEIRQKLIAPRMSSLVATEPAA